MDRQTSNINDYQEFDNRYANTQVQLGLIYEDNKIKVSLWQPLANKVELIIFDHNEDKDPCKTFLMSKKDHVWSIEIDQSYDQKFYKFRITHQDNSITYCLDPYAYSIGKFNWEQKEDKVAKAAFVDIHSPKAGNKPRDLISSLNNSTDPLIYELHIRDFSSLLDQSQFKSRLGTFKTAINKGIFPYLEDLGITHLQLLPIHATYTVNDYDTKIYLKGQATKWSTNYNWGYDPHNYFSINGIYIDNLDDPYQRINEFKEFVDQAHKHNIGIILDVVYNHMMTNSIFNNILDGYYYRNDAKTFPVSYPPLADNRLMVRKLIIDSLVYFVKEFNVDGFRFDLSCFLTKQTLDEIREELRKIKPNIVLHGEAWQFSDLDYKDSYIKGITTNNIKFAYFNDSIRDAIKGSDHSNDPGLIIKNNKTLFDKYLVSIVGGIKDYIFDSQYNSSHTDYDQYANDIGINLAYSHCHDGMTLWDKINVSSKGLSFDERIQRYRQGSMLSILTVSRQLILGGSELLQSKPNDISGMDDDRAQVSYYDDYFNEQPDKNSYHSNSYKTSDYVNGIKWDHLNDPKVFSDVYLFTKQLNKFRNNTKYFRYATNQEVIQNLKFDLIDPDQGIIIFKVFDQDKNIVVIHNFGEQNYEYQFNPEDVILSSRTKITKDVINAHSTFVLGEYNENN
ncbi:alpha-amylase family glycosyl hydrolase [Mycoplasma bradburyae]|uniref:alpha-amylase family glycosyl hydrolase n=1 Tax=Mycoplasma bradburyae TaxID=2963128 RepID=UPI002341E51A|nr:alpha-amylase family glycosyl hydrolase [Mycoplasma bradburyae]MDC4183000.1 alpha-amylase [Mycoplasma bradburyae]